ncbi:MAG TPA: class E sortase [Solirubrobacteraceae bacterium]|jgi:sortase A|nr:class E sortase [Solirubrobacteraceae bacterium]
MKQLLSTTAPGGALGPGYRRRSASRRAARAVAIVLVAVGCLALADALVTLVWQEPISALYASIRQHDLGSSLRGVERAPPSPAERHTLASLSDERARIAFLARELERRSHNGAAVGRIMIPRVGADYVMVKGTDTADLISGPGIYPETSFPGIPGTTAVAGHRTTYLAPFREINFLKPGNHILLYMPYAHFTYTVTGQRVVWPSDVGAAVSQVGYSRLVLSACTPVFSAEKRLLVYARLTRTVPVGAARTLPGGATPVPIEATPRRALAAGRRSPPAMLVSLEPHGVSALV